VCYVSNLRNETEVRMSELMRYSFAIGTEDDANTDKPILYRRWVMFAGIREMVYGSTRFKERISNCK